MPNPDPSTYLIVQLLKNKLKILENNPERNGDIVRLKSHKKAIKSTIPKLPEATGSAYTTYSKCDERVHL